MNKLKIGLIQMKVSQNKKENLDKAYNLIKDLTCKRVDIVVLPEMFSTPMLLLISHFMPKKRVIIPIIFYQILQKKIIFI